MTIISPDSLGTLAGMVRDNANNLNSNQNSAPIIAFQHNNFREGFFKATYSLHHGHHEFKAGVESDNAFLHETSATSSQTQPNSMTVLLRA